MKIAECFLQDRPIRRKNFSKWCKPEIVASDISRFAALPTVCGTDKYTLDYKNMTADDWEIKPEPMKVEFECEWLADSVSGLIYPSTPSVCAGFVGKMHNSGKRFKVTCVEIEE